MKYNKTRNIVGFFLVIVLIVACAYVAVVGVDEDKTGSAENIKLGLDLAGGVSITYEADEENPSSEDMSDTVYKLTQRVSVYSDEAEVYQEGSNRITVEIPGVYDAEEILESLGNPGSIEFYEYTDLSTVEDEEEETEDETSEDETTEDETTEDETSEDETSEDETTEDETTEDETTEDETSEDETTEDETSEDETSEDEETEDEEDEEEESESDYGLHLVLDGDDIVDAQVDTETNDYGNNEYVVHITFSSEGAEAFEEATENNVGSYIYIYYDDELISYPYVSETISGGECVIEGDFTYDEADSLATSIRLGTLNLSLTEVSSSVVGATLGSDALETSLLAAIIGFIIIVIFMIVFYRVPGVAASIALTLYMCMMLLFLNALDVTLTLAGIAGIILSIGMAVDANIIIFTRIKEEISAGKKVQNAIKTGFKKAQSAILDGNITTLIAAVVLYFMGTGSIRSFAVTLMLGIILSMITALLITRILMAGLYSMGLQNEKFYGRQKEHKVIHFTGFKKITYSISVVVIAVGIIAMVVCGMGDGSALNFSLEFTGGTSMTVSLDDYIDVTGDEGTELTELIEENAETSDIQLQNVQDSNDIIIKTPVLEAEQRTALKEALEDTYGIDSDEDITEENISAVISNEMRSDAIVSLIVAGILMLIYIWIRFKDIRFGASAVIALLHDVLVVLTVYAVTRISVGNTFIACMLTIVGYSINGTIVIFDRIRENSKSMRKADLDTIVNTSITQTLSRTINTSLTTFIMVLMLFILGVSSIREFALPLMAGIISGAYSSIFITATLWAVMRKKSSKKK